MTAAREQTIVIMSAKDAVIAVFATDRDTFAPIATFGRDRVFVLTHTGSLGVDPFNVDTIGAVYVEADPWRITLRSLDKPTRIKRRRKARPTADILPFPSRTGNTA